jgi:hypothetical protein
MNMTHKISYPTFSVDVQEKLRHKLQDCASRDCSSAPPCPQGIPAGQSVKCDCEPIKKDPAYGVQNHVCMARLPCPVRVIAGLVPQEEA